MITTWTQPAWGMSGPVFLWVYGALCLTAAVWIWWHRITSGGSGRADANHTDEDLGVHELAFLNGGPQLAITSAATQLLREGIIKRGEWDGALTVAGELDPTADPLERAVFETIAGQPFVAVETMRSAVQQSVALRTMQAELVDAGLLRREGEARSLRWDWLIGAALTTFGLLRLVAVIGNGAPIGGLLVMVGACGYATTRLLRGSSSRATRSGAAILDRWRDARSDLTRHCVAGESTLTAALFGAGALWLAEPEIASALALPREQRWERAGDDQRSGGGGGCGGGGCGGCGGCG